MIVDLRYFVNGIYRKRTLCPFWVKHVRLALIFLVLEKWNGAIQPVKNSPHPFENHPMDDCNFITP
jgi:hypothetical protein